MPGRLLKKGRLTRLFKREREPLLDRLPEKTPTKVDAYRKKLKERLAPSLPVLDAEVLDKLRKFEQVRIETPFADIKEASRFLGSHVLKHKVNPTLEDYVKRLVKEVSEATNDGEYHEMEKFFLEDRLKELKKEQELAENHLVQLMKKKLYPDGTVFDTTDSLYLPVYADGEEHPKNPDLPCEGEKPVMKTWRGPQPWKPPAESHFNSRHFFAVIDGNLVPLIKLPDLKKR